MPSGIIRSGGGPCKKIQGDIAGLIIVPEGTPREVNPASCLLSWIMALFPQNEVSTISYDIIIIDQPEDDLDNKVIYDEVISAISKTKPNVQFIFATHNANIPVLGDAERVLVVDFNETDIEVSQGNIDMLDTQKQIIDIMEGGREAFDKRKMIYTSWRA